MSLATPGSPGIQSTKEAQSSRIEDKKTAYKNRRNMNYKVLNRSRHSKVRYGPVDDGLNSSCPIRNDIIGVEKSVNGNLDVSQQSVNDRVNEDLWDLYCDWSADADDHWSGEVVLSELIEVLIYCSTPSSSGLYSSVLDFINLLKNLPTYLQFNFCPTPSEVVGISSHVVHDRSGVFADRVDNLLNQDRTYRRALVSTELLQYLYDYNGLVVNVNQHTLSILYQRMQNDSKISSKFNLLSIDVRVDTILYFIQECSRIHKSHLNCGLVRETLPWK